MLPRSDEPDRTAPTQRKRAKQQRRALRNPIYIPQAIGDRPVYDVLPEYNRAVMARLDYFIVENERTARRFHKSGDISDR